MDIQGTEACQQPHLPVYITNLPLPTYLDITVSDAYNIIVKNQKNIVGLQAKQFLSPCCSFKNKVYCLYVHELINIFPLTNIFKVIFNTCMMKSTKNVAQKGGELEVQSRSSDSKWVSVSLGQVTHHIDDSTFLVKGSFAVCLCREDFWT